MDVIEETAPEFAIGDAAEALEALSRHSGDCVKLVDLDGRVVRWNGACEDLYGWSAEEAIGRTLPHIPPELRLRVLSDIRRVTASGRVTERDGEAMRADGTRVMLRLTLVPVTDPDGHAAGVVTTARELTGDRRLEKQRDQFVAFIGRHLRDPLAAIDASSRLLLRPEITGDSARCEATAAAIAQWAHEALTLVEDLLVVSELTDGTLVLNRESIELGELVEEVLGRAGVEARPTLEFDPGVGGVPADRERLTQAITCLMDNALARASSPDAVHVSIYAIGGDAIIDVADDGEAISVAERERLFERYHAPYGEGPSGSVLGVGLYLARHVAEAHGGCLLVSSPKDGGSLFSMILPLEE